MNIFFFYQKEDRRRIGTDNLSNTQASSSSNEILKTKYDAILRTRNVLATHSRILLSKRKSGRPKRTPTETPPVNDNRKSNLDVGKTGNTTSSVRSIL